MLILFAPCVNWGFSNNRQSANKETEPLNRLQKDKTRFKSSKIPKVEEEESNEVFTKAQKRNSIIMFITSVTFILYYIKRLNLLVLDHSRLSQCQEIIM